MIDRQGVSDIAAFRISNTLDDLFGVRRVSIETPLPSSSAITPEPSSACLALALTGLALRRRRQHLA